MRNRCVRVWAWFCLALWGAVALAQSGPPTPPPEPPAPPPPLERLAHHDFFLGLTNDLAGWPSYPAMVQENIVFERGAAYLNGLGRLGPGGYRLQSRNLARLNYRQFSFSMQFMAESLQAMQPLISGGVGRWMELRLEQHNLVLGFNGGGQSYGFPAGASVVPGEWTTLAFSLDLARGRATVSLNGGSAHSVSLPPDLVLAVETRGVDDRVFNFENRAFNTRFAGWLKTLYVFDRALSDTELAEQSALAGTAGFTQVVKPPPIGGLSIAAGSTLVVPMWNVDKPLEVVARSPAVCVIENWAVARLLQPGMCQVEYRQQDHRNPAATFVSVLSFPVLGLDPPPPSHLFTFNGVLPASSISLLRVGGGRDFSLYALLDLGGLAAPRSLARAEAAYNVYVVALMPSGAMGVPVRVALMKNSLGNWGPAAIPLDVFLRNAQLNAVNNQVALEILLHADVTSLSGTEFYIGYGLSDTEMLAAGRYRGIYVVP